MASWTAWLTSWFAGGEGLSTPPTNDAQHASKTMESYDDLDLMGFLRTDASWRDREGRQVVLVAARKYVAALVPDLGKLCSHIHSVLETVSGPYVVVWLHTHATYNENCPSISWLWATYSSLPEQFRANLVALHLVHCDVALWAATQGLSTTLPDLWHKIRWIARIEFLEDHIDKHSSVWAAMPTYVLQHDGELEEQPLSDYGIVAAPKDVAGMEMSPEARFAC